MRKRPDIARIRAALAPEDRAILARWDNVLDVPWHCVRGVALYVLHLAAANLAKQHFAEHPDATSVEADRAACRQLGIDPKDFNRQVKHWSGWR